MSAAAMKNLRSIQLTLVLGGLVAAILVVLLSVLVLPAGARSDWFWLRVTWAEILFALFFASLFLHISVAATQDDSVSRLGGITPSIVLVVGSYGVLSLLSMLAHAFAGGGELASRTHWISQLFLFALLFGLGVFLAISRQVATGDHEVNRSKAMTPRQLHDLLAAQERRLAGPEMQRLKSGLKQLRETLAYSLHESESLAESPAYQAVSREVEWLCEAIGNSPASHRGRSDWADSLSGTALAIRARATLISQKAVRR